MKEGGRLKRSDVELLQEVSQETVFKILETVNHKLGGETSSDGRLSQKVREKKFIAKDRKGEKFDLFIRQQAITLDLEGETVTVSKINPKDETMTKFFFRPANDTVIMESYAPRFTIATIEKNMPEREFSSYMEIMQTYNETQATLENHARTDERNHGYNIVTEAEARELLDLLERSKPKKKRWWRNLSKNEHLK